MKVKELIGFLQKEDPERLVIVSIDEEGNRYHEARAIDIGFFYDSEFYGTIEEIQELIFDEDEEINDNDLYYLKKQAKPCFCIWI